MRNITEPHPHDKHRHLHNMLSSCVYVFMTKTKTTIKCRARDVYKTLPGEAYRSVLIYIQAQWDICCMHVSIIIYMYIIDTSESNIYDIIL